VPAPRSAGSAAIGVDAMLLVTFHGGSLTKTKDTPRVRALSTAGVGRAGRI
jgi:hypothetical protein